MNCTDSRIKLNKNTNLKQKSCKPLKVITSNKGFYIHEHVLFFVTMFMAFLQLMYCIRRILSRIKSWCDNQGYFR